MIWHTDDHTATIMLQACRRFHADHGHLEVRFDYVRDGLRVGAWLNWQRLAKRRTRADPVVAAELDRLGFVWDPHGQAIARGVAELRVYAAQFGHARVPQRYVVPADGYRLGVFVHGRRVALRRDKLTPADIATLDAIGAPRSWRNDQCGTPRIPRTQSRRQ